MSSRSMMRGDLGLAVSVALTVLLFNIPYGPQILYPFGLLATWFHEMGHGLTAWALGADFTSLVLRPDTSGFAIYRHADFGVLARAVVASAGYMGTAIVGFILLTLRRWPSVVPRVLGGLSASLLLSGLLVVLRWPSDTMGQDFSFWLPIFGFGVVVVWGAAIGWVALRGSETLQHLLFSFIAAQTTLNAVLNIRVLFLSPQHSDADTMAELLLLPSALWATLWLVGAVALGALGAWLGRRPSPPAINPAD